MSTLVVLLKWFAQILLFASGVWALLGAESLRIEPATGRRRLTINGWSRVLMLAVGFALFVATDWNERRVAKQRELLAQLELKEVRDQNQYLKHLFLLQFDAAGVELDWTLDAGSRGVLLTALRAADTSGGDDELVAAAFERGKLEVRRTSGDNWSLHVEVDRDGKRFSRRFPRASPEWQRLEDALATLFADTRVELSNGELVAEPLGRHWPCRFTKEPGDVLTFRIEKPGVSLGSFDDASVLVRVGPGIAQAPESLRLRSLDPKVEFDVTHALAWRAEEYERYSDAGGEHTITRLTAEPFALEARFQLALSHR